MQLLILLVFLFLAFDAKHPHQLVQHEDESSLVATEHEIVDISPRLTIIDVFSELVNGSSVHHPRLRPALCPRSLLEIIPTRSQSPSLFQDLWGWVLFELHKLLSVYRVAVRLEKVGELFLQTATTLRYRMVHRHKLARCHILLYVFLLVEGDLVKKAHPFSKRLGVFRRKGATFVMSV